MTVLLVSKVLLQQAVMPIATSSDPNNKSEELADGADSMLAMVVPAAAKMLQAAVTPKITTALARIIPQSTEVVDTGLGSQIRSVSFGPGIKHAIGKLTKSGPSDLSTLDPGGSMSKWMNHLVKTATTGEAGAAVRYPQGTRIDVIAPMQREAGGTIQVGARLWLPEGGSRWRLTTILTEQF